MAGTSIGQVIDWLVTALPAPARQVAADVEVADYAATTATKTYVYVGRQNIDDDESTAGELTYGALGKQRLDEAYTIPICIDVARNGPAYKPARDVALALLDVVVKTIHDDLTLGGIVQNGRIAQISNPELHQAPIRDGDGNDTALRRATVLLTLAVQNTYTP